MTILLSDALISDIIILCGGHCRIHRYVAHHKKLLFQCIPFGTAILEGTFSVYKGTMLYPKIVFNPKLIQNELLQRTLVQLFLQC
jgi:hypothetical protein